MSGSWLTLITILSVSCTAVAGQESGGPVWKSQGGSITIHCNTSLPDPISVALQWRLHEEAQLLTMSSSGKNITKSQFQHRLKAKVNFPKLDITITDLTLKDTGAYWCVYTSLQKYLLKKEGSGSLLLVVKGDVNKCEDIDQSSPLMVTPVFLVVLCSLVVFILSLIVFFIWIIPKVKIWQASMRPTHPRTNDVYEDMRATLRR